MNIHFPIVKHAFGISALAGTLFLSAPNKIYSQNNLSHDVFEMTTIPPEGTDDSLVLAKAPSAEVKINGQKKNAIFVVDEKKNILYQYNGSGKAINAYSVATGKETTPTHTGLRIVSHIETYPYRTAGRHTKRRRNPRAYGPKIIILDRLDPKTGERSSIGEFIHGTNNLDSIGKKISHGCMRLDNEVIKMLAEIVKRGDIVLIK